MANSKRDQVREHRIAEEIIVDAYGEGEQALGWYYYLGSRPYTDGVFTAASARSFAPPSATLQAGPYPTAHKAPAPGSQSGSTG